MSVKQASSPLFFEPVPHPSDLYLGHPTYRLLRCGGQHLLYYVDRGLHDAWHELSGPLYDLVSVVSIPVNSDVVH